MTRCALCMLDPQGGELLSAGTPGAWAGYRNSQSFLDINEIHILVDTYVYHFVPTFTHLVNTI